MLAMFHPRRLVPLLCNRKNFIIAFVTVSVCLRLFSMPFDYAITRISSLSLFCLEINKYGAECRYIYYYYCYCCFYCCCWSIQFMSAYLQIAIIGFIPHSFFVVLIFTRQLSICFHFDIYPFHNIFKLPLE